MTLTKEYADHLVSILTAFRDGKTIQRKNALGVWVDSDIKVSDEPYRIKPEPREFWINVYAGQRLQPSFNSDKEAQDARLEYCAETIHVREVV